MSQNQSFNNSAPPQNRLAGKILKAVALMAAGAAIAIGALFLAGILPSNGDSHTSLAGGSPGAHDSQLWTCGMHPDVILEEPGACPICHMDLVPLRMEPSEVGHAGHENGAEQESLWTCSMHPEILESEPGTCPVCGMDLVPVRDSGTGSPGSTAQGPMSKGEREILFYRNPMDPNITAPVPRKDDMGMDYVPVYADEAESAAKQGAVVRIDPAVVQNMNVTTEPVERRDVSRQIRTVGYLEYDQERMVSVTTKYDGFIEKTYVNYVGEPVKKGEPLFEIYSPELVQTEQELLSAKRYVERMRRASPEARNRAEELVASARERLSYWDISDEQIERLENTGTVFRTLQVVAPASGLVMKRMPGLEGMAAKPGMELLHIADLSNLWLAVEVFENQLPWVDVGSTAEVALTYFPGETFSGRVRFVEPEVSEKTRSVRLMLDVHNRNGRLRVGMYATVVFEPVAAHNALTVPSHAVLRTGQRDVVIVAVGEGRFAPREVVLGPQGDGFVQVLRGLSDGDEVVTSAQFLIDSESNLREAIQKMIASKRARANGVPGGTATATQEHRD
jgi:RND family efflux transporter MFP subunit